MSGLSKRRAGRETLNSALVRRVLRRCRVACRDALRQRRSLNEIVDICRVDATACQSALTALTESGFLIHCPDGTFLLSDYGAAGDWTPEMTSRPVRGDAVIMRRGDARYALSVFPNRPLTVYPSVTFAIERARLFLTSPDPNIWYTADRRTFERVSPSRPHRRRRSQE